MFRFTPEQKRALAKRVADAMEKLSIGCFMYWVFMGRILGFILTILFIAISLIITAIEAKK